MESLGCTNLSKLKATYGEALNDTALQLHCAAFYTKTPKKIPTAVSVWVDLLKRQKQNAEWTKKELAEYKPNDASKHGYLVNVPKLSLQDRLTFVGVAPRIMSKILPVHADALILFA